jgi:hypothetical protein
MLKGKENWNERFFFAAWPDSFDACCFSRAPGHGALAG